MELQIISLHRERIFFNHIQLSKSSIFLAKKKKNHLGTGKKEKALVAQEFVHLIRLWKN